MDEITLGIDVGIDMGSLVGSFIGSYDGKLEGLFLDCLLGYTDGKVLVSEKYIKLGLSDSKLIGTILVNVYGITLGLDVGIELGSLDESFGGSNDGKI